MSYPRNYLEVDALKGKVICFNKEVEKTEVDFDSGMKARVIGVRDVDDDVFVLDLDFSEFEESNKKLMANNYYDSNGHPTLKWCETSYYPKDCKCKDYFCFEDNSFDVLEF